MIISNELLGTKEFIVINHTDCGMLSFTDSDLQKRLEKKFGNSSTVPLQFHSFSNLEENVRNQVSKIKSHPLIPKEIPVTGFIYDVETGLLRKVT